MRICNLFYCLSALMLASCGIKGPLIAPKDIPQYEAMKAKRQQSDF